MYPQPILLVTQFNTVFRRPWSEEPPIIKNTETPKNNTTVGIKTSLSIFLLLKIIILL